MDKYAVKLYARAARDLEDIYAYIAGKLSAPGTALETAEALEQAILSLQTMPERGAMRQTGVYANKDYRQLFVKNYTVIYRVEKEEKEVRVVTVRYARSDF